MLGLMLRQIRVPWAREVRKQFAAPEGNNNKGAMYAQNEDKEKRL